MVNQGYVTVASNNMLFPSIGVNTAGKGAIDLHRHRPGLLSERGLCADRRDHGAGDVHIAGAGVGPADGFTGYAAEGGNGVERWGDYSAAVAAPTARSGWRTSTSPRPAHWRLTADSTCGGTRTLARQLVHLHYPCDSVRAHAVISGALGACNVSGAHGSTGQMSRHPPRWSFSRVGALPLARE